MMKPKRTLCMLVLLLLGPFYPADAEVVPPGSGRTGDSPEVVIGLYRLFETNVMNRNPYANRFTDVELLVRYVAPSGRILLFRGFYDGDGKGGGDAGNGIVWKMRFMPDEIGTWHYDYSWSDGTPGGSGSFDCSGEGAGRGMLQPYHENPHWFAYNGTDPVWLKSYYETGHGSIGQDFGWIAEHVYGKLQEHGYNHLQVNWLLSLCCFGQFYGDGPEPESTDLFLYREGGIKETMNLEVWHRMEQHMEWLNDRDIGVHMFLGVDGSKNDGPAWSALNAGAQDFYVRYMVARLAPYANLAGWNFVWEVPGDREEQELGFMRLVQKYDVFGHLRTYEDEMPREHCYHLPEYTFAAVENHRIAAPDKNMERHLWKEPWTHHMACLLGYAGKPVYMSEGNALWRRYWQKRTGATRDDLRRAAWACATAGASFTWNGHAAEYGLKAGGPEGLPFNEENPYRVSEKEIELLSGIMTGELEFYRMKPHDELLSGHAALRVYALAEPGQQYLVFAPDGEPFSLMIDEGIYSRNVWINARTGERQDAGSLTVGEGGKVVPFSAPHRETDWVLLVRKQ
ncbi:MAG: DUF5060 domain-containing protein [Bacteroidales bacterium]|nr:DUF5060 domain-containing protein [Bacteroidales bacterium]